MKYYVVVEESNYPCESMIEPYDIVFFDLGSAVDCCRNLAKKEYINFTENCGDGLKPSYYEDKPGYIITCKNGIDSWYYFARIIECDMID